MKTKLIKGLSQIQSKYDAFFIDLWGVIHNGVQLYPGAINVLENLNKLNKRFVLISNAPRPSKSVEKYLINLKMDKSFLSNLITSGEVALQTLKNKSHNIEKLILATNSLGENFGSRKAKLIFDNYPNILREKLYKNKKVWLEKLITIDGIEEKTANQIIDNWKDLQLNLKWIKKYFKINSIKKTSKTNLKNINWVLTGFRDKDIENFALDSIKNHNGDIYGVDIAETKTGDFYVIECNRSPNFIAFRDASKIKVEDKIVDYCIDKSNC